MTASPAVSAPLRRCAPVQRFQQSEAAVRAIARYEADLCENAARRRSEGATVVDQDQPEDVFCLCPAHPRAAPLVIVGGMGALTGARAFRQACARFGDARTIVLYQACSIPDRSTVIVAEHGADTSTCRRMALRLADAVRHAVSIAGAATQRVCCIIACNSAHYFLPLLEEELRRSEWRGPCNVQIVSLVACAVEAARVRVCQRVLLLATEGARVGQVFSAPFRDAGISFEEPSPFETRLLMRAVFEGLKSLDPQCALALGNEFFEAVLRTGRDYDCVVAGCTEVSLTIELLRFHGSSAVTAFLSRVQVVDPLDEALCRA